MVVSAGILGATGYTGGELIRLLYAHPGARLTYCSSNRYNGSPISDVLGFLRGYTDMELEAFDAEKINDRCDLVFCCLPHGVSMDMIPQLDEHVRVIDLGADYRLRDLDVYTQWYKEHTSPELLASAVYGLADLYAERISAARLVANPGCYPTSVLIPLIPLLEKGLIDPGGIIVDAKSGASGAGRSLSLKTHICEAGESFGAYKVGREHRHIPEIEQELGIVAGQEVYIDFIPHLIPITRGMLSTIYVRTGADEALLRDTITSFYKDSPFVHLLDKAWPSTKDVRGTNKCIMGLSLNKLTGRAIIVSVIDNLTKGASGQAVQNMNIMYNMDVTTGLDFIPLFP
ncbi:MAG: N-acetyl-gamma-glutamyl-phosphate reductase [Thermodesulfobacteriota bacterium]|nr:N-acetyl-gamma-glutamyl-phosphate reductase [Thermodesulfobacteriota bacterium]